MRAQLTVDQCDVGCAPADSFTTHTHCHILATQMKARGYETIFFFKTGVSFELASPHYFSVRKHTECMCRLSPAFVRIFLYALYTFLNIFFLSFCLSFCLLLFTDKEQY